MASLWHIACIVPSSQMATVLDAISTLKVLNLTIRPVSEDEPPKVQPTQKRRPRGGRGSGEYPNTMPARIISMLHAHGPLPLGEIRARFKRDNTGTGNLVTSLNRLVAHKQICLVKGKYQVHAKADS